MPTRIHLAAMPMCLILLAASVALGKPVAGRDPNIVVIYADDLGYGDVACYNPQRGKIPTPHIDRLAKAGMRFTDAHSSSGVCSPSRYTLLTGRYHWRTRLQKGIVGRWGSPLIAENRITVATLLRRHGYRTGCIGKWHLGWDWPIDARQEPFFRSPPGKKDGSRVTEAHRAAWRAVFSQPIPGGPTTRGFDTYFGTDVPNWPPYCFIENDRTVGVPTEFLPAPLFRDHLASIQGPALADWKLEPILPTIGRRAGQFITQAAERPEPFFLYLPLTAPHTPLAVSETWRGRSRLNTYADFVMQTDAVVGQVVEAIERSGQADHTLVVFTSDNGCAPYIGVHDLERMGHFPSGPLRGYKADVWEGGHRVPFVVRWPGVVEPGVVRGHLVHQADLLATCAEIVGATLPAGAGEDSVSLLPLLRGEDRPVREIAVSQSSSGLLAIRKGPWKLIFGPGSGGWDKGRDALPAQLYHLGDDLAERQNLYADKPEMVAELTLLMDVLVREGRSTPGMTQQNDVPVRWRRFLERNDL
ncbi:MAG: arylsulfatase [Pirellulales bacterium]